MPSIEELLTPDDVARLIGVEVLTLARWRSAKRYPLPYVKVGHLVRYRTEDVARFIAQGRVALGDNLEKPEGGSR